MLFDVQKLQPKSLGFIRTGNLDLTVDVQVKSQCHFAIEAVSADVFVLSVMFLVASY